ncbi:hypothetical protein Nwi_1471 [Nitrobacter winogradskyi Nb-255]|uniref:Uncharacterized protein n=1 Tax=Nitrobacter winogradskyi (strain ATCC 25391 / DSM 10237 / CIP 104748 / NCIMB 11846 / Nb-255) TaxID=323098 RepID=Q3SSK9_NITWN|nr:tape measure protein [Nitrobacter winogradskyi]ABA04732.1 hypothetical protein Nwi_1471 [Nitrobacter winogradskyi Nb-255]
MAEDTGERLVVMLEARISEFEKRMVKAEQTGTRTYRQLTAGSSRATKNMEQDMLRSTTAINRSLAQTSVQIGSFAKAFAVGIAGSAAFRTVSKAAQEFTSLQNALKVTGLEDAALDKVFSSLFQIAQKNGTAIEPLVTLYSRASQAQKELKANSADLMKFTDGVSIALRVAGTNSTEAAGALLQLSQAIGSGVVRAEEFNSVNEGARPILQAVAAGLKEAGGSVSTLKNLVNDGKVSSEAFFRAFLAGMPQIEAQAAKADGTIGQASARIGNAFIALVGHLDKTTGASGNAAKGLTAVAGVVEKLSDYFDAASGKLETLQKWLTSVGNNSAWTTIAKFFGADFSPEEMAKYGLTPVGATPATPARVLVTGGTTEGPKVNPVSLADFKVPGKKDGAAATRDPFERSNDQIAKRIELLKVEAATIDQTATEQDRARVVVELETAAKQANERAGKKNVEVTAEQRAKIEALADAYAKARGELERLNSPLASFARESADVGRQLEYLSVGSLDRIADDFGEIVTGTKTVEEAFKSMAQSILAELAKIAVKQAVLGPLANLMGGGGSGGGILSALIPKFANGTDNAPGGLAIVGEKGPELVNLPRGSQVIPNHQIGSVGGGGDINVPVMVNIDATGADAAGLQRVEQQVADLKANLPMLTVQAVRNAKNRRLL